MNGGANDSHFHFTFASLTIILLSFFVFFNSISVINPTRQQSALASVRTSFPTHVWSTESETEITQTLAIPPSLLPLLGKPATRGEHATAPVGFSAKYSNDYITLRIPATALFAEHDDQILSTHLSFLQNLSREIASMNFAVVLEYSSFLGTDAHKESVEAWDRELRKLNSFSRLLLDSKIRAEYVESSLRPLPLSMASAPAFLLTILRPERSGAPWPTVSSTVATAVPSLEEVR